MVSWEKRELKEMQFIFLFIRNCKHQKKRNKRCIASHGKYGMIRLKFSQHVKLLVVQNLPDMGFQGCKRGQKPSAIKSDKQPLHHPQFASFACGHTKVRGLIRDYIRPWKVTCLHRIIILP